MADGHRPLLPEKLLFQLIRLEVLLTGGLSLLRAARCGSEQNQGYNSVQYIPGIENSARFNRLGGAYQNGKPLPKLLRRQIIALAQNGVRQCDISRRLRITHGCVSKILSKYQRTGHFEPGRERDAKLRIITTPRALRTDEYMQDEPGLFSWDTRRARLRQHNLCREGTLYSLGSIRRSPLQVGTVGKKEPGSQEQGDGCRSHMIANILNLPSNEQSATTSNESQPLQLSERFPQTAVSGDLSEGAYFPLPIKRRKRIKYTSQQIGLLEAAFQRSNYLTPSIEKQLARDTGVITAKIQVWFSNRRAKERKKAFVASCADSNTRSLQGGIGNSYPDFAVPPPQSVIGPSRIYFPFRPGVNN